MANTSGRIDVGRVIFLPDRWVVQTLYSHVGGVVRLAQCWDHQRAFQGAPTHLSQSHEWLIEAARIHDMGKPARFHLDYKKDARGKWKWEYSFAGHRFDAFHEHPYAHELAQLHHEYSVTGITKAIARLRLKDKSRAIADHLPLDLYALEMCDQIEATFARAALDSNDPEERVFMDFQFRRHGDAAFEIEPFAFDHEPVRLQVEYVTLVPPSEKMHAVVSVPSADRRKAALRELEKWLIEALQNAQVKQLEVTVLPWTL